MLKTTERNLQELKSSIVGQLLWDSRVDASNITVEVSDGTARLSGTVPTYADRRYAGLDASLTPGINTVNNELLVRYPSKHAIPDDSDIASRIRNVYLWSSNIDATRIDVGATAGVVTLRGSVDMYWKKIRAEQIAADMTGVIDVINELAIVPARSYSDQAIARDIESAIARNTGLNVKNIDVRVSNGIVTLSGAVPDRYSYRMAADIARYTSGVIAVRNTLSQR